jgi:diguanylate cyclase (GGDEF)-like protein/PAS domain S-box-containing protein
MTVDLKLLLVEDSADDEILLVRELSRKGYAVDHMRVETAAAMRSALEQQRWDLVISDHSITGFDPLSALALVREYDEIIPFVIVSGAIREEQAVEAMAAGAADYVMKGNLARLAPAIERELAEAAGRRHRRVAEQEVRRIAAIVDSSFDAIIGHELDGTVTSWNPAAQRILGYSAVEMVGHPIDEIVPADRHDELQGLLARLGAGGRVEEHETIRVTKDGRRLDVALTISPIHDEHGAVVGNSTIARDITDRNRARSHLVHLADHDALTGLYNRRRFEAEVERQITLRRRYSNPATLLLLDLDNFKAVNDTMGHGAGDSLISDIASALQAALRETDIVARLGGDEFVILLPETDARAAYQVAESLRAAVADHPAFGSHGLAITASVGIAPLTPDVTASELMVQADLALYDIKDRGRNGIAEYKPEARERLTARIGWTDRIRRGLDEHRFSLFFQPIIDLTSGHVGHGELLLRLTEDETVIAPGNFIEIAEHHGIILEIDRWVIRTAIELLGSPGALPADKVTINLSGRSFADPDLADTIENELLRLRADPARLIFEITETAVIANIDDAITLAERLKSVGCGVALDAFGSGFGSFCYLKHLPVDLLKIDGEFIRRLPSAKVDQLIVRAIAQVADGLGLPIIAEFVEDAETVKLLSEYGITYGQGYHLGRPRPLLGPAVGALLSSGKQPTDSV